MATHHIVAMLPPAWGHTISYINAVTQMLAVDPTLVITIVQHNLMGAYLLQNTKQSPNCNLRMISPEDGGGAGGVLLRQSTTSNHWGGRQGVRPQFFASFR